MKTLFALFTLVIVASMAIVPAYAAIIEFKTDRTSYKKGDVIVFSGKTNDEFPSGISVRIYGPQGTFVELASSYTDFDSNFEITVNTASDRFQSNSAKQGNGIYNATVFYGNEPPSSNDRSIIFDFSVDGSPVVPSAADIMQQSSQPAQQPTQEPAEQPTQQPAQQPTQSPPPTTNPTPPPPAEPPQCGPGTVLSNGVCVVAQEPEPAEPKPKTTHIPGFPDPTKDPQHYVDRYNTEPEYKEWFDRNFPSQSIYEIVGLPDPIKKPVVTTHIPGFPDPTKDPQHYVDRYNTEPEYKEWFDRNFPGKSIYQVLQIVEHEPELVQCGPGTHLEDGACVLDNPEEGGGCLIATAAYGTELSPQVQQLREVRDIMLMGTSSGSMFLSGFNAFYYSFSPTVADWERQNPVFKDAVRTVLAPMLTTMSLLNYVEINSEQEMMGYGVSIIMMNVGMYLVAPALVITGLQRVLRR